MKILLFSPQYLPSTGGLQNIVHYWANQMHEAGHDIVVVTYTNGTAQKDDLRVVRRPSYLALTRWMSWAEKVLMFNVSLKAVPAWFVSKKTLIINHQTALYGPDQPFNWKQKLKKNFANRFARLNVCCSHFLTTEYRNVQVLANPYNDLTFRDLQVSRKPYSVLFAGRLVSDKGADLLIEAFAAISHTFQAAHLTIVGDGPERQDLEQQIQKSGVAEKVSFAGNLSSEKLCALMNQHEILVVPSRFEPFGIIVLEGLAAGCRVIVSDTGGLKEAGSSFVETFKCGDRDDLAATLSMMMGNKKQVNSEKLLKFLSEHSMSYTSYKMLTYLKSV